MGRFLNLAALAAVMVVAACTQAGHYPISHAKAGPDDPVLHMPFPPLPQNMTFG